MNSTKPLQGKIALVTGVGRRAGTDTGWMTEELKEQLRKESKRGKVNTPEDIARLIVCILTEKKYPTGEVIHAER